jgi:hypothetical protein
MPQIYDGESQSEVQREMAARWKYILRNPEFRRNIRELRALYREDQDQAAPVHNQIIEKWGLKNLPFDILTIPYISDHPPYKNAFYETICPQATIKYPIEAHVLSQGQSQTCRAGSDPKYLQITIDLSYPDTQLLYLIAEEISATRPQRRYRDKDDDYLAVYDLAEQGKTLRQIALDVESNISTVKSRLRTACERIYGADRIPSKWRMTLSSFNADRHFSACEKCRNAFGKGADWSEADLCEPARQFLNQDHVAQDASPHRDIEGISDMKVAKDYRTPKTDEE